MRWDELFEDLEVQLAGIGAAERDSEVAERIRIEDSRISWTQRLRAHVGRDVDLEVCSLGWVRGVLTRVGVDVAVVSGGGSTALVPLSAVLSVAALGAAAETGASTSVASRLGLGSALRALARDRAVVTVSRRDGQPLTGTPARVGNDYLELAVHAVDDGPRPAVSSRRVIPFAAVVLVRSARLAGGP